MAATDRLSGRFIKCHLCMCKNISLDEFNKAEPSDSKYTIRKVVKHVRKISETDY